VKKGYPDGYYELLQESWYELVHSEEHRFGGDEKEFDPQSDIQAVMSFK